MWKQWISGFLFHRPLGTRLS